MKNLFAMVTVLIGGMGLVAACGDDSDTQSTPMSSFAGGGPCGELRSECVSEREGRTCPGDGSTWVTFPCGADQRCSNGRCVEAPCTVGSTRCRTLSAVEACLLDDDEDPVWQTFSCRPDQHCNDGLCVIGVVSDAGDAG